MVPKQLHRLHYLAFPATHSLPDNLTVTPSRKRPRLPSPAKSPLPPSPVFLQHEDDGGDGGMEHGSVDGGDADEGGLELDSLNHDRLAVELDRLELDDLELDDDSESDGSPAREEPPPAAMQNLLQQLRFSDVLDDDDEVEGAGDTDGVGDADTASESDCHSDIEHLSDSDACSTASEEDDCRDSESGTAADEDDADAGQAAADWEWTCTQLLNEFMLCNLSDKAANRMLALLRSPRFTLSAVPGSAQALKKTVQAYIDTAAARAETVTSGPEDPTARLIEHHITLKRLRMEDMGLTGPITFYMQDPRRALQTVLQSSTLKELARKPVIQKNEANERYSAACMCVYGVRISILMQCMYVYCSPLTAVGDSCRRCYMCSMHTVLQ